MATKKNIIVGAARVYIGPSIDPVGNAAGLTALKATGTATQDALLGASGPVAAGWRDVGYTQEGLEIATNPSWGEVQVDQLLDSAKIFKDSMTLNINTTFAEATLENLLVAWGQQSDTLSTGSVTELDIDGGSLGEAPVERGLIAVGNGKEKTNSNDYAERSYFAYRALSVEAVSTKLSRSEASVIPVSFRILPADNGKYGSVRERLYT